MCLVVLTQHEPREPYHTAPYTINASRCENASRLVSDTKKKKKKKNAKSQHYVIVLPHPGA